MKTKQKNSLPKTLPGAVCAQMVRCGKPTCKCALGELHGPYFYRFVWEGGRQRKIYVKQQEVAQAREACEARRKECRSVRIERKADRVSMRTLLADLAEYERLIAQLSGE